MLDKTRLNEILLNILEDGITFIRHYSAQGKSTQVNIEADHLHNIPSLINNLSRERLEYYLNIEVKSYRDKVNGKPRAKLENEWSNLRQILEEE
ncbi:hypothetical protein [Zooshikella ganghwensis]|uniref:hypothetical protein n=1 Tax=Zooshikella ganghwensis TaxID=202772 RepID=UPI0003FEB10E|nr:hypothetical protein [Zooshikella ganghwensis]